MLTRFQSPGQIVGINWANPLARGLVAAPIFGAGGADPVKSGRAWSKTGWAVAPTPQGAALDGTGYLSLPEAPISGYPFSFAVLFKLRVNTAGQMLVGIGDAGGQTAARLYNNSASTFGLQSRTTAAGGTLAQISGLQVGKWHLLTGVVRGDSSRTIMLDKVTPVTNTGTAAIGFANLDTVGIKTDVLTVGSGTGDSSVAFAAVWAREVTQKEHLSLLANPWQLFKAPPCPLPLTAGGAISLGGAGGDTATGTAAPALQVALAGIGIGTAGGSAADRIAIPLQAAGLSVASGTAGDTATITIAAAGLAQAAAQAGIAPAILLQGAAAAQAAGSAALAAQLNLLASGAGQAGGTAAPSLSGAGQLAGGGAGQAGGVAGIVAHIALQAAGASGATGTAAPSLNGAGQMAGGGAAQAGGIATIAAAVTVTAAGFVQAMTTGQIAMQVPLQAFAAAQAAGQAAIQVAGTLLPLAFIADHLIRVITLDCAPIRATRLIAGVTRIGAPAHA